MLTKAPAKRTTAAAANYRTIAPSPNAAPMGETLVVDPVTTYSASVNPPRKAKRHRPISDINSDEEDELESPNSLPSTTKRARGREEEYNGGNTISTTPVTATRKTRAPTRAAREALRKANHSRIEKARRTKINDALARLREFVPSGSVDGVEDANTGSEDKGFKLEVLVRTVTHLEKLTERMKVLESSAQVAICSNCKMVERSSSTYPSSQTTTPAMRAVNAGPSQRSSYDLSISSLVNPTSPDSAQERSRAEKGTPTFHLTPSTNRVQLPSPPLSGVLAAEPTTVLPPSLTLPPASSGLASASGSPTFQPTRTPEDESAATMLLNIKTKWSAQEQHIPRSSHVRSSPEDKSGTAQTPGSILGITKVRGGISN